MVDLDRVLVDRLVPDIVGQLSADGSARALTATQTMPSAGDALLVGPDLGLACPHRQIG